MIKSCYDILKLVTATWFFLMPSILSASEDRVRQDYEFGTHYLDYMELSPVYKCDGKREKFEISKFEPYEKQEAYANGYQIIFGEGSKSKTITSVICSENFAQILEFCGSTGELVIYTTVTMLSQKDLKPSNIGLFDSSSSRLYLGNFPSEEDYKIEIDAFTYQAGASLIFSGYSENRKLRRVGYFLPSHQGGRVVQVITKLENGSTDNFASFDKICPDGKSSLRFETKYGGLKDILIDTAAFLGKFERKIKALEYCRDRFTENSTQYDYAQKQIRSKHETDYEKVRTKVSEIFFNLNRPNIVKQFHNYYSSWGEIKLPLENEGIFGAKEECKRQLKIDDTFYKRELTVVEDIMELR